MIIIEDLDKELDRLPPRHLVLAMGNFDGLHLGHQAVIGRAVDIARQQEYASAVLTFKQHPRSVLQPDRPPLLLLPPGEKVRRIGQMGVEVMLHLDFTLEMAHKEAEAFISEILWDRLKVSQIVIGENFRFGKDRRGCPEMLRKMGQELGFLVTIIPPIRIGEERVSSSLIRRFLQEGNVRQAAVMLNREYEVAGTVVSGDSRGREIGFPTANLEVVNELIPLDGVYAAWAVFDSRRHPAMMNLGKRPTFPDSPPAVEVHLIDFDENLYHKTLAIHFVDRLRDEKSFPSVEALKDQLVKDRLEAIRRLGLRMTNPPAPSAPATER